jgi:hypothetical protein
MKPIVLFCIAAIISIHANTPNLPAAEQLSIYPSQTPHKNKPSSTPKGGISALAKQTVASCHYQHKYQYDAKARTVLASSYSLSTVHRAIVQLAGNFCAIIMLQLDKTAQTLPFSDKKLFWHCSGEEIKKTLRIFCNEHGIPSSEELNAQIDQAIQTKIRFG